MKSQYTMGGAQGWDWQDMGQMWSQEGPALDSSWAQVSAGKGLERRHFVFKTHIHISPVCLSFTLLPQLMEWVCPLQKTAYTQLWRHPLLFVCIQLSQFLKYEHTGQMPFWWKSVISKRAEIECGLLEKLEYLDMEGLLDAAHAISKVTKAACYFHCIAKAYYLLNMSYNLYTTRNGLKSVWSEWKRNSFSLKQVRGVSECLHQIYPRINCGWPRAHTYFLFPFYMMLSTIGPNLW